MAMNKKEQQAFNDAVKERDELKAMLYAVLGIVEVERDLLPPKSFSEVSQGWDFNAYNGNVYQAWSNSVNHGTGIYSDSNNRGCQNSKPLFSTMEKAKQALLNAMKLKQAEELSRVYKNEK